jgi:hypothetical protein
VLIDFFDFDLIDSDLQLHEKDRKPFGEARGEMIAIAAGLGMPVRPRQHHDRVEILLQIADHSTLHPVAPARRSRQFERRA